MDIIAPAEISREGTAADRPSEPHGRLRRVFERSADALYRFILVRVGGNREAAEDLLQQTCCEAVAHRQPPLDEAECEAWLRGIARNLIRRHQRRWHRKDRRVAPGGTALTERVADDQASRASPVDQLIADESDQQLMLAITSLAAEDQELVFAHYFAQRSQAQIAGDLGITEKAVERRLHRARARLRTALQEMERSGQP